MIETSEYIPEYLQVQVSQFSSPKTVQKNSPDGTLDTTFGTVGVPYSVDGEGKAFYEAAKGLGIEGLGRGIAPGDPISLLEEIKADLPLDAQSAPQSLGSGSSGGSSEPVARGGGGSAAFGGSSGAGFAGR